MQGVGGACWRIEGSYWEFDRLIVTLLAAAVLTLLLDT
jgi:hypothetical protein